MRDLSDTLSVYILVWSMYSVSLGITAWFLGSLLEQERNWRSLIPGWNVVYLFQIAGLSAVRASFVIAWFLVFPLVAVFLLMPLGGALMKRTGRPRFFGFLLTFPPLGLLGLPIIAASAERLLVDDSLR